MTRGRAPVDAGEPVTLTDPRAIKALAHPARLAVLDEFFNGRKLTATECAEISGLSASAMSYHLRALEKWGIIRRSEATGDGRERPWEAAGRGLRIESQDAASTGAPEAMLITRMLDRQRQEVLAWINRPGPRDTAWDELMSIFHSGTWLTPEQARELTKTVEHELHRFDVGPDEPRPAEARRVRVSFTLVPTEDEDDGAAR